MRNEIAKGLVQYAAGRKMFCDCGVVLDRSRTVVVTSPSKVLILCATCWGKGPWCWDAGEWSVYDGRVLFGAYDRRVARKVRRG